jgi:hypothetical protein
MADESEIASASESSETAESELRYVKNTKGKAEIWKDFMLIQKNGALLQNVAACKLCKVHVKFSGGTSNLYAHKKSKHPLTLPKPKAQPDANNNQMPNVSSGVSTQQTIPNILAAKYHAKSQKAIQITNSIATFIAKDRS